MVQKGAPMLSDDKSGLHIQVYNYVLDQIFQQKLSYGQKISEEEIAQSLNVSRTPIREALRKLESDGLVEILPKRFAQIVTLTEDDMRQLGTVKLQLDFLAAQLAVHHGSNSDFAALERTNESMADALARDDHYQLLRQDAEFHQAYIRISGNALLVRFHHQLQTRISLFQSISLREKPDMMSHSLEDHQAIIDALYSRDVNNLLHVIVPHIVRFYNIDASVYSLMLADFSNGRNSIPPSTTQLTH